jgi:NADH-quinone oxidoreductase subunit C
MNPPPSPSSAAAVREALLARLRADLGTAVLSEELTETDLWVRVDAASWGRAAAALRELGLTYFSYLSAIDWLPNPALDGEQVYAAKPKERPEPEIVIDPVVRKAGGTSRFQVIARLEDVREHVGVTVVSDVPEELVVPSWSGIFPGADWHEREAWEMYGVVFDGHPGLRHIYLPEGFEGFPLRKDFPLLAREVRPWPGLVDMEEMPPVSAPPTDPTDPTDPPAEPPTGLGGDA